MIIARLDRAHWLQQALVVLKTLVSEALLVVVLVLGLVLVTACVDETAAQQSPDARLGSAPDAAPPPDARHLAGLQHP